MHDLMCPVNFAMRGSFFPRFAQVGGCTTALAAESQVVSVGWASKPSRLLGEGSSLCKAPCLGLWASC